MKAEVTPEPIRRSALRPRLGRSALCWRRRLLWHTNGLRSVRPRSKVEYPYLRAEHTTPLLRRLRGEDMAFQRSKVANLCLAMVRLDDLTLRPGETLSFWRAVGEPTRQRDYVGGMILCNGRIASDVGSGLCQMTNLFYWMTLHTPPTVTERWRHDYDVLPDSDRTQPLGSGTTCFYNHTNLMMRSDTLNTWRLVL